MSTKQVVVTVLVALTATACSADTTSDAGDPATTTPADSTTTTRPRLVDGGLIPIDPATLIPLSGAQPISIASSFDGLVSANGRWAVLQTWRSSTDQQSVEIVNLTINEVVSSLAMDAGIPDLSIDDNGNVYLLTWMERPRLELLRPGAETTEVLIDEFPSGMAPTEMEVFGPQRFGLFGTASDGGAHLFISDLETGEVTEVTLPNVGVGVIEELELIDDLPVFETANPAVVWDTEQSRVLIVEATRDIVTAIETDTGHVSEHPWESPTSFLDRLWAAFQPTAQAKGLTTGTTRSVVMTRDGSKMYIATSTSGLQDSGTVRSPQDLIILDTKSWGVTSLDIMADTLWASPNPGLILAQGSEVTDNPAESSVSASPIYVIDPTDDSVTTIQTTSKSAAEITFSPDGNLVYIATQTPTDTKIEILDLNFMQLTGAIEFRELSLIGPAGLMAFHLDQ